MRLIASCKRIVEVSSEDGARAPSSFFASDSNHSCNISLDLFDLYGIVLCSREREHMSILKEL